MLRRPYNATAEDGSGWVSVEKKPDSDMSPPRKQRTRKDSPSPEPEPRQPRGSARDTADFSPPWQLQSRQNSPLPSLNSDLSPPRVNEGLEMTHLLQNPD